MQDKLLQDIIDFLIVQLRGELLRQGHKFTGALSESIEGVVKKSIDSTRIDFLILQYGHSLNKGIKPSRIPYTPGSGRKKSKYIQGLMNWVKRKLGYSKKRAERIAFAIASAQKRKGYPLTGKIGWIDITLKETEKELQEKISIWVQAQLEDLIDQLIKESNG